jgi:HK97 family phage portal protein
MGRLRTAFDVLLGRPAQRSISYQDVWGSGGSTDLLGVGDGGTLSVVPLYSAIRLIADQFASTPLHGYRTLPNGTPERLRNDPSMLTPVSGSKAQWKTECIMGLLTRGNAFGLHTAFDATGYPSATVWVPPQDVQCDDDIPGAPKFWYLGRRLTDPSKFVHIPWLTLPGRTWGLSPLGMFKTLWETAAAAQNLERNFYDSGGVPSGHFKNTAKTLTAADAATMKTRFKASVVDRDVLVTGNDWEYNPIGLPADQLAFVSALKLTATQIAGIYGIAPEDIGGEAAAGLQYSTVEMNQIKLSTNTMRPWYTRVEDALGGATPRGQYFKFNADALVRSDLVSRMTAHQLALSTGVEIQDEARHVEDKQPLTPEQFAQWQQTYKPVAAPPTVNREDPQ